MTDAVKALIEDPRDVVPPDAISKVIGVHASQIRYLVKHHEWDQDRKGNYIESGNRVKFFRLDFLRKNNLIE